jgi:hypothetical protein
MAAKKAGKSGKRGLKKGKKLRATKPLAVDMFMKIPTTSS